MDKKNSILIVDDVKANLLYLNHLLSPDYVVYAARNATEALERAAMYHPDLMLLDIVMPDMDGYEVLAELKASDASKDIPVIFITGLSDENDEMKGLGMGAEDYITKPFHDEIVTLKIRNQIKIINQMRALDKRLEQQTLMTSIAQCFLADGQIGEQFTKTLGMIGEFMEIAQVLLFNLNSTGEFLVCENEWINPELDLGTRIGSRLELKGPMLTLIQSFSLKDDLCIHSNEPVYKVAMAPYRVNFENYITAPIFIKGKLCAVLDFSRESDAKEWSDSEINLACLAASLFSGVFERESIERDLDSVMKLKSELTVEKERAEHNSRSKSEFLSRMSHEMRMPMDIIMGMTNLARGVDDSAKRIEYLGEVADASQDLQQLIDDVLNASDVALDDAPLSLLGKTVLLVDDVDINREIVMVMLEDFQPEIDCAVNGREAVELFKADPSRYDIILMDINMPEMDGVEATVQIRGHDAPEASSVPIIAMTANVLPDEVSHYLAAGMNDHIGKPIDFDKFMALITTYVK